MKEINVDDFAPELDELWDNGTLGRDEHYVAEGRTTLTEIDEVLGIETVSLRFTKDLLQDLKDIAELNGLGYQPLIKQILQRFVDGRKNVEKKIIQIYILKWRCCRTSIFYFVQHEKNLFTFPVFLEFWKSIGAKFHLLATTRQLQNERCHGRKKLPIQRHTRIGLHQ